MLPRTSVSEFNFTFTAPEPVDTGPRGRIDPGIRSLTRRPCGRLSRATPPSGALAAGADPPLLAAPGRVRARSRAHPEPWRCERQVAARSHSERCCGIPASRARTSVSLYRRCPPSVRMEVSFPALAHLVTVFGSTRNIVATSAGVSSGSASGVRADMFTASPPGPVLRSCVCSVSWLHWGARRGCPIWSTQTILPSPAVTSRPPGAKFLSRVYPVALLT